MSSTLFSSTVESMGTPEITVPGATGTGLATGSIMTASSTVGPGANDLKSWVSTGAEAACICACNSHWEYAKESCCLKRFWASIRDMAAIRPSG